MTIVIVLTLVATGGGLVAYQQAHNQRVTVASAETHSGQGTTSPSKQVAANPRPKAVRHVRARSGAWVVHLTWDSPRGGDVDHYVVKRDGTEIASAWSNHFYADDDVLPGSSHSYTIVAVSSAGRTSPPRRADAVLASVPLSSATVSGTYAFRIQPVSHFGFSHFYEGIYRVGVDLHPACSGCGTVDLRFTKYSDVIGELHRDGTGLAGTAQGRWIDKCGNLSVPSHFSFSIRVMEAYPDNTLDELVASKLTATMHMYDPPRYGCVASGATFVGTAS